MKFGSNPKWNISPLKILALDEGTYFKGKKFGREKSNNMDAVWLQNK
jgi:hypothetical protein